MYGYYNARPNTNGYLPGRRTLPLLVGHRGGSSTSTWGAVGGQRSPKGAGHRIILVVHTYKYAVIEMKPTL